MVTAVLFGAVLVACKDTPTNTGNPGHCATTFDYEANPGTGSSSPAPGALTLTGHFYPDETVEVEYIDGGGLTHVFSGRPPSERNTLTLTGLPSGTRQYVVDVSCADGQDESHPNGTFTIQ